MIDWLKRLLSSKDDVATGCPADQRLLMALRDQLNECEAVYRAAARLCIKTCPDRIGSDPESFHTLMLDLHRGLLMKVFVGIARCDRRWHPTERAAALILLNHVWDVNVREDNLAEVLRGVAELEKSLKWKSVLGPFVRLPALADEWPELHSLVMRIDNLVAKADGRDLPDEERE